MYVCIFSIRISQWSETLANKIMIARIFNWRENWYSRKKKKYEYIYFDAWLVIRFTVIKIKIIIMKKARAQINQIETIRGDRSVN